MNTLLLIIIGLPILEITLMIKMGQQIGAFNTILIIFFTAIVGIYYAKIEGINTIRSGMTNLYQNKIPFYEILSGASIAIAAILLILPGFISDIIGFLILIPFTRKTLINFWLKNKYQKNKIPFYEMLSGASIAIAAILLILPGFISDTIGFLLLLPFTRKILINFWLNNKYKEKIKNNDKIIDAEVTEETRDKDEL